MRDPIKDPKPTDVFTDSFGRRYTIIECESTDDVRFVIDDGDDEKTARVPRFMWRFMSDYLELEAQS